MLPLGVIFIIFGYAMIYTGAMNFANGGQGPKLGEVTGLWTYVNPPSKQAPNLMGQPPANQGGE